MFLSIAVHAQNGAVPDSSLWQPDESPVFARYGEDSLAMDVYYPHRVNDAKCRCVVFIYGGAFMNDNQRSSLTREFCRTLAENDGIVAVAIDYRLGLKDRKFKGKLDMIKPLENSILMAVEDCSKAVAYILENAMHMRVDPQCIVLCGSSAGAITALQSDYELCRRSQYVAALPEDFHFAGIVSFAGAVFSREGKAEYKLHAPAPTMMLHGTKDNLVTYDRIAFFKTRFSGSNDLIESFKKGHYPHLMIRFEGEGHGVSMRMMDNYGQIMWFMDNMVGKRRNYEIDMTWNDHDHVRASWDTIGSGMYFGN